MTREEHLNKTIDLMAAAIRRQSVRWAEVVTKLNSEQTDDAAMSVKAIRDKYLAEAKRTEIGEPPPLLIV
jgi:hypothetical protein